MLTDREWTILGSIASLVGLAAFLMATRAGRTIAAFVSLLVWTPIFGFRLMNAGVYEFFESRRSLPESDMTFLKAARKEIGIIALSLNHSVVHQGLHTDLQRLIKQNQRLSVFIFLLNPNAQSLSTVAAATGRRSSHLKEYIEQTLSYLSAVQDTLDVDERRRFNVCLYDTYLANSMIVVDPDDRGGLILVENYLYKTPILDRYSLLCKRRKSPMYSKLKNAYEQFKEDFGTH